MIHREKKLSHFDLKSWVTGGITFYPAKWVTGDYLSQIDSTLRVKLTQHWESNWLNIESQIGSTLRVKLAQHWESNWLNIENQIGSTYWESNFNIDSLIGWTLRVKYIGSTLRVKLVQHWESNWLNIESQNDPILRVKLTQHWESNWLKYSPVTHFARSNYR